MTSTILVMLTLFLFTALAQPVAYVDLSGAPKVLPSFGPVSARVKGGGLVEGPNNLTDSMKSALPVNLKVVRLVESSDVTPGRGAVEVLLTNTSTKPVRIPVGTDETSLLGAPAPERFYLAFAVWIGTEALIDVIGTAQSATNGEHPETAIELQPGASVEFKVPFDKRAAAYKLTTRGGMQGKLSASVGLYRIEADQDGDYSRSLSLQIKSENLLKWGPRRIKKRMPGLKFAPSAPSFFARSALQQQVRPFRCPVDTAAQYA